MSALFERNTSEIRRVAGALTVPQEFRDPFNFNLDINGRRSLSFNRTGPASGDVSVAGPQNFDRDIGRVRDANIDAGGRFDTLISRLKSNENPFISARVRPAEEAARAGVADARLDVGRREIAGSIGQNQINNARFAGAREVADQGALATNDALSAQLAAEAGRLGIGEETLAIAESESQQELRDIQAGMEALQTALRNQEQTSTQLDSAAGFGGQTPLEDIDSIIGILDGIFGTGSST